MSKNLVFVVLFSLTFFTLIHSENLNQQVLPGSQENFQIKNPQVSILDNVSSEANEMPSEDKNLHKRRIYSNEQNQENINLFTNTDKYSETHEYGSKRKNNYSEKVNIQQEYDGNNRQRKMPLFSSGLNNMYSEEGAFSQRQRDQMNARGMYDLSNTGQIYDQTPTQLRGGNSGFAGAYSEDTSFADYDKISAVKTDQHQIRKQKIFNGERETTGSINSRYPTYRADNYDGFQNPGYYNSDKGLVINFNTECPMPGHTKSHFVHKLLITPKSHLGPHSSVPSFYIPTTGVITGSPVTTPHYYHL